MRFKKYPTSFIITLITRDIAWARGSKAKNKGPWREKTEDTKAETCRNLEII